MKKPNREKINDLLIPSTIQQQPGRKTNKNHFERKLNEGDLDLFKSADWIEYFKKQASPYQKYVKARHDSTIINSIMKKYSPAEIKNMIDYLFSDAYDYKEKWEVGIYLLSSSYLNSTYNGSILWKKGGLEKKTGKRISPKSRKEDYSSSKGFL